MSEVEFKAWPKMTRNNPFLVTITEKMDGTNACIIIEEGKVVGVQSRHRFITPESDNYGFAQWVKANEEELLGLGDGYHYGEWVGLGIQKNPHNLLYKKFFLFDTKRWDTFLRPACCEIVATVFEGEMDRNTVPELLEQMLLNATAEESPEGVVVYYHAFQKATKHTIRPSPNGKWCK